MDNFSTIQLDDLALKKSWQHKFKLISQWGDLVSPKPDLRIAPNLVKGCETQAWLAHTCRDGYHFFYLDADSKIIRGLGALLLSQVDNKTQKEIESLPLKDMFISHGLEKHLNPSRANGFRALTNRCCALANIPPKL